MDEISELKTRIEHLEASRVAMTLVCAALMQSHPQYDQMQLWLTRLTEQQLTGGALGKTLTPAQNDAARDLVEWLQSLRKI